MAYGLYLYKQIINQGDRVVRLEIYQKDYVGASIELDSLQSATLVMDNQGEDLTAPIIKSSLNFTLVNTNQFNYEVFFTPDATKFKVVYKLDGVTEWTGYLTPDSYTENLSYRDTISLVARDNLGLLEKAKYLPLNNNLVKIEDFVTEAMNIISFPFTIIWESLKTDSEDVNIKDRYVRLYQLSGEKNYLEILESLLSSLALQMRYIGGNQYKIIDINNLYSLGSYESFIFANQSGQRELVPATSTAIIEHDYQKVENVYFVKWQESMFDFVGEYEAPGGLMFPLHKLNANSVWKYNGDPYVYNPFYYKVNPNWLYITGIYDESTYPLQFSKYYYYDTPINKTYADTSLKFSILGGLYNPYPVSQISLAGDINIRCRVLLISGSTTYNLKSFGWVVFNPSDPEFIEFTVSPSKDFQELSINITQVPSDGVLRLIIYPYELPSLTPAQIESNYITDLGRIIAALPIRKITLNGDTGQSVRNQRYKCVIDSKANVELPIEIIWSEVPENRGDGWSFNGGIYKPNTGGDYKAATGWKWAGGSVYNLRELCVRQIIHNHIGARNKLSGAIIKNKTKSQRLLFDGVYSVSDSLGSFILNYASLNLLTEEMQCELWEAKDYDDIALTFEIINEDWES